MTQSRVAKGPRRAFQASREAFARVTFLGAAGEVTGSCFHLETGRSQVLVDLGMFQGGREADAKNRARLGLDWKRLDAVVLTHAHLDHAGRVPLAVARGYRGPIHTTAGTRDLSGILLLDSAHIQESDAERESRRRRRRGQKPVEPLYTQEDARAALAQFEEHAFQDWFDVAPDVRARFHHAGHILGAASVEFDIGHGGERGTLLVSGDLGRAESQSDVMRAPTPPPAADWVLVESTYGDRRHRDLASTVEELGAILKQAMSQGSTVLVPVFAVGRAQEVLGHLAHLEKAGVLPPGRVVLDSPMAIDVTGLYRRHSDCLKRGLDPGVCVRIPKGLRQTRTPEESMALNREEGLVILSASGMCEGGRILHHLKHRLWRSDTHLVFTGFQAGRTTGAAIVGGARTVRVMGETIAVKAKVHTLGGFSAHADQSELLDWLGQLPQPPRQVALVHGEDRGRTGLAAAIDERLGWPVMQPRAGDELSLSVRS
ncbi:MAG: MBL fold metallo-hydrolase [Planctomycetaceae bacterium]|nr:MBL fold metallo-hydrolase [Planctomycetaceae bacterium]